MSIEMYIIRKINISVVLNRGRSPNSLPGLKKGHFKWPSQEK